MVGLKFTTCYLFSICIVCPLFLFLSFLPSLDKLLFKNILFPFSHWLLSCMFLFSLGGLQYTLTIVYFHMLTTLTHSQFPRARHSRLCSGIMFPFSLAACKIVSL